MILVPGPVQLYAGAAICRIPSSGLGSVDLKSMARLGQTENGVQISISNKAHRVNVDDMGGTSGAPADLIYLGSSASIRGVLVDYGEPNSSAVTATVREALWGIARGLRFVSGDTHGTEEGDVAAPGTPLFEYGYGFSLFFIGIGASYYFPRCEFSSSPREWNVSSLERKTSFTATAYEVPTESGSSSSYASGRCLYVLNPAASGASSLSYTSCRTTSHSDMTAVTENPSA